MKKGLIAVVVIVVLAVIGYYVFKSKPEEQAAAPAATTETTQQAATTPEPAPAPSRGPVHCGVAAEPYPPFSSKDANGKWVGFEMDLMNAVCEAEKMNCELVETAWDGIIPALTEKKIDVIWSSMSRTEERR